jgi:hypothetical protein
MVGSVGGCGILPLRGTGGIPITEMCFSSRFGSSLGGGMMF